MRVWRSKWLYYGFSLSDHKRVPRTRTYRDKLEYCLSSCYRTDNMYLEAREAVESGQFKMTDPWKKHIDFQFHPAFQRTYEFRFMFPGWIPATIGFTLYFVLESWELLPWSIPQYDYSHGGHHDHEEHGDEHDDHDQNHGHH